MNEDIHMLLSSSHSAMHITSMTCVCSVTRVPGLIQKPAGAWAEVNFDSLIYLPPHTHTHTHTHTHARTQTLPIRTEAGGCCRCQYKLRLRGQSAARKPFTVTHRSAGFWPRPSAPPHQSCDATRCCSDGAVKAGRGSLFVTLQVHKKVSRKAKEEAESYQQWRRLKERHWSAVFKIIKIYPGNDLFKSFPCSAHSI